MRLGLPAVASSAEILLNRHPVHHPAAAPHGPHLAAALTLRIGAQVVADAVVVFIGEAGRFGILPLFLAADVADTIPVFIRKAGLLTCSIPAAKTHAAGVSGKGLFLGPLKGILVPAAAVLPALGHGPGGLAFLRGGSYLLG